MNKSPFFSVIVPVYNVSQYLGRCIDSILSQTYNNFELLLINDGSTDDSGRICDEYAVKDSRIKVFHKKNGGVSSARNKGIDEARGKYVVFVDSDDYLLPERLLRLFKVSTNNPDMIVGCSSAPADYKYKFKIIDKQDFHIIRNIGVIWTSVFNSRLLKENNVRFDETIWHGEDSLFILNFFYNSDTIIFVDKYGYVYESGHEGGLNIKFQNWEKELYVYKKIVDVSKKISDKLSYGNRESICMNFGQILRVIKAIYKNSKSLKCSERVRNLKTLGIEQYERNNAVLKTLNSNTLIYLLFNNKQYFLLDMFMQYFWRVRN